mmetsp:Transcript_8703/g.15052  ORF Transcript_8703/g.15052 Transcript_8703/m.15052 type:complete len:97 (-) Transcript_8703:20-310(-)|eukprot:CAMPEP_0119104476 /NCGR_PEP_ID=MMETSP1180-20130426/2677_1 /TAXON_ID=3052 ORGANISM="Chlamydomonas cf sp, Strain CCMP681" /NCGR_SAMPLE_ID=MMETSP1180 /ASSEMBLY_ACC=CAM_ASM_000741 /LENGTH=96 /DNA_ID=CAMNT_0007089243 /DNA_START=419 /DNA_END=709 /DNA_ORIENTATION=+
MSEGGGDTAAETVKSEAQPINVVVKDQTGGEVHFKIKTSTKMEKVFKAYCDKKSLTAEHIKFMYDGARVLGDSTPASLGMEDDDSIDAMILQTGGN